MYCHWFFLILIFFFLSLTKFMIFFLILPKFSWRVVTIGDGHLFSCLPYLFSAQVLCNFSTPIVRYECIPILSLSKETFNWYFCATPVVRFMNLLILSLLNYLVWKKHPLIYFKILQNLQSILKGRILKGLHFLITWLKLSDLNPFNETFQRLCGERFRLLLLY